MSIYDASGNQLDSGSISTDDVVQAYIEALASGAINPGSVVGATLGYNIDKPDWLTHGQTQYAAMLAVYKTLPNDSIPFFISTDQHGAGLEWNRWANNMDVDGMEYANVNLGDTINWTVFSQLDALIPRVKQVKNYLSTPGNHDYQSNATYTDYDMTPYEATKAFLSTRERKMLDPNSDTYVVVDGLHDAKFLVADNYWLNGSGQQQNDGITGSFCDAIIEELSKDDYDIIYIQHWCPYAVASELYDRNGTADSGYNPGGSHAIRTILSARKAKTNGTVTDADGVSHAYDFRNMTHNLLCGFYGHRHKERYGYLDGVLCYIADAIVDDTAATFGIIDRKNSLLRVWRWNETTTFAEFDLPLTQT